MTRRQLTIKPSCMREIATFPSDRAALLWDKIDALVSDPLPDGKVKKKLKGADGVYRMRVTDHRVFYRFGEDWISLLGIRRRAEDTYDGVPDETADAPAPDDGDDNLDALIAAAQPKVFQFKTTAPETTLPEPITQELLRELGVPVSAVPTLLRCKTEEALLEAPVPPDVLGRVVDRLFPPTIERLDQQPDLVVPSTKDLVRFKEGDLLGFLLRLDEDQLKLTQWAMKGPTMVRGGAGTGKSTVALYRVKALLERPGATGAERVLFTTYTRSLLTVTQQLLEQLLIARADEARRRSRRAIRSRGVSSARLARSASSNPTTTRSSGWPSSARHARARGLRLRSEAACAGAGAPDGRVAARRVRVDHRGTRADDPRRVPGGGAPGSRAAAQRARSRGGLGPVRGLQQGRGRALPGAAPRGAEAPRRRRAGGPLRLRASSMRRRT
jgi:mRNA-degrading endonuclease RelE of RelBE toxin-antitoxin system